MRAHFRYLNYVLRHKWFVFVAGLRTGAPLWRLVIHDWTKFLPSEWFAYVANFYGKAIPESHPRDGLLHVRLERERWERQYAFDRAWLHHQHASPHHWQHWLLMNDSGPDYPRYHITSMDGGLNHHALTEYQERYRSDGREPISAEFTDCLNLDRKNDERYRMVYRCCDEANARKPVALPMPEKFVREMVADWMGAGRAITGKWEAAEWYQKNRDKMVLHPETRKRVEALLSPDTGVGR